MSHFRKDVDFNGLFRKLGHSLEEIRVRALESIQSKLDHNLICDADLVQEKLLYIRLLEWFNFPNCNQRAQVLALIKRLAQHVGGAELLQDIGAIEFLSQLRCDIEASHRPVIDQILEQIMCLPDTESQGHAPECIYHRPSDSAVWGASMSSAADGSRSHVSEPSAANASANHPRHCSSVERLSQHLQGGPAYFAASTRQGPAREEQHQAAGDRQDHRQALLHEDMFLTSVEESTGTLFRLSMFPWLPLTQTDQQVIASTNSSLQSKDPAMLIGSCEFLADVVFQDFPAEIFFQRPEILKSLLSLVSMPNSVDHPVVIQACKTLTIFIRCLQVRIRYFQDPALYTSKQDFDSTPSSVTSTPTSGAPSSCYSAQRPANSATPLGGERARGVGDTRHRGDGQDGDSFASASRDSSVGLEPDPLNRTPRDQVRLLETDAPRPRHQQLTLPQLLVAVLQRALPRLRTSRLQLGVAVLELSREALAVLRCVLDQGVWTDTRDAAREVVDRLTDCLDCLGELLNFHHYSRHSETPLDTELGDLTTHRILYMGAAATLTRFFIMIPLEKMSSVLPEQLRSSLGSLIFDQPLAIAHPQCRTLCLAITQSLGLSSPADFQLTLDMCRSLTKACTFCLQAEDENVTDEHLAALAEDAFPSLSYHLHLPFVSKFVHFIASLCSKKKSDKATVAQCTSLLLKLLAFPVDSIRETCSAAVLDVVKQSLQVSHASSMKMKESLKSKFVMNAEVLYQLASFGLADSSAKVRNSSSECLHYLLQSQLLMSEGLWQELMLALGKAMLVLQSYTDESTALGRRLLSMLDPTTTSHNLSLLDKLRASLRLMYLADKRIRLEAAKHLKWFLGNERGCESRIPSATDLDLGDISQCLILGSTSLVEEDSSRSVFTEEGMMQVFDIFTSSPVDPGVKKSAGDQLATMMKDPHLHALFKEKGGVEVITSLIQQAVQSPEDKTQDKVDASPHVPACIAMLKCVAHHDYSLRHTLARDNDLYYTLLRVALLHQETLIVKSDVSHLLVLLLFDEVAKFDIGSGEADAPGTRFSLPAQVIQRYRLPFKPSAHHINSPNTESLPDRESNVLLTSGPRGMMRVAWNLAWQGGLEPMLDSFSTRLFQETSNEFDPVLQLSEVDCTILKVSCVPWQLRSCLASIRSAGSHAQVTSALERMLAYTIAVPGHGLTQFLVESSHWYTVLERFLLVTPISSCDQNLLLQVLTFVSSALMCLRSVRPSSKSATPPVLTWLVDKLYRPDGPLMSLMNKPLGGGGEGLESDASGNTAKRSLDKQILQYVISINMNLPYQLCKRAPPILVRGDFVRRLQRRLNISEAPHFYNLASLEGTLSCLMHVTARPGWSKECSELDATSLCNQLLNSLLEVVWSFHIGRGGTSLSFMGKGVTKSTALCLRHLAFEMNCNSEHKDWVKNWLYTRQDGNSEADQGLNWLLTLWAYRDSEVRVAGLGIAVALTSTEAGRLLVTSHCRHIPGGIWGAAFSILLDPVECSLVCQQAALLLVNLTSQTMPSGDVEITSPGGATSWQGPVVTDEDYQSVLVGVAALQALVAHTRLYASVSDLLADICWASLVQPVLVTTELPLVLDASLLSSASDTVSDASELERTGRTALTTVTSESGHPTPSATQRSKQTLSAGGSQGSAQDSTLSSSTATDLSHHRPQPGQGENNLSEEGHSVTTPGLVSAVVSLLNNLVQLHPLSCLAGLRAHGILSSLISLINPGQVQTLCEEMTSGVATGAAGQALHNLLAMYGSVADLLNTCVTMDTNIRAELLANRAGLGALTSLLLFQWHDKDDIGSVCTSLSVSVLHLLSSLLQTRGPAALVSLTPVLGPIWLSLTDSLTTILKDRTHDRVHLLQASLDFLALVLTEESRNLTRDPDRVMEAATLSELLDAQLSEMTAQEPELPENSVVVTTGQQLCRALVSLFEPAMAVSWEEKASTLDGTDGDIRLKLLSALKALLAVSQTAKQSALDAGVVETTIEQLKQTHAQLNLETLGIAKLGGKKESPLLQELGMILDFLRTFMCNNVDVKVACHHSGLTTVIQRLWAWCQQEPSLLTSVLTLLTTYSAHCNSAASSLTSSVSVSATASGIGKSGASVSTSGSLLHYVLKLAQKEIDRDECTPLLRLTFGLLTNLALNSDCRTVLWKSPFLNQFSQLNPRKRRGKIRAAVDGLWCELILALSFSVDGQQIILKVPDCLTVLMDLMEAGSSQCQHNATLIVRNLCCHAPNKPKLLAAEKLVNVLMQQIENGDDENTQLIATSALWALVYNNHKARVQVKSQNVAPRLVEVLHTLQGPSSRHQSQANNNSCVNLKAVILAVRD